MPDLWTLVLDGSKYTERRLEEAASLAAFLCLPVKGRPANTLLAFTTQAAFVDWATRAGVGGAAQGCLRRAARERARLRGLSSAQLGRMERERAAKAQEETRAVAALLRRRKVAPDDPRRLLALARRGEIGSVYLYDRTWFRSPRIYLSGGVYWKLGGVGWNDRTESAIDLSAGGTILYQHTYFRGVAFFMPPFAALPSFGWFNNRASSAVVGG